MQFQPLPEEIFLERINKLHPELKIISKFEGTTNKILVENEFGVCKVIANSLLVGCKPTIRTAINKKEYLLNQFKSVHGDKYDYSKVDYINATNKIIITCPVHGDFIQQPIKHLQKRTCPKCGRDNSTNSAREQATGWQHSDWVKAGNISPNFQCFMLYIIKMYNEEECFYKIGKTFIGVDKRFAKHNIKYNIETIYTLCEDGKVVSQLEDYLKRENAEFKYTPKHTFGGMHECFSQIKNIEEIKDGQLITHWDKIFIK
jgi:hypothetical protein